jgi:hypothetical protein
VPPEVCLLRYCGDCTGWCRTAACGHAALACGDQMQFDQLKRREFMTGFVKSFQYLLTDLHQFDILQSGSAVGGVVPCPSWVHQRTSGDVRGRSVHPRSRNAALAAASRSASDLIVIQAPGVSARSDSRWRSERTWNSNGPVSAASIAVKHGSAWTYHGGMQLSYSLHPRRPATASRAKLRHRRSPAFSFIPTDTHQWVRVGQAGTCSTFDPL